MLAIDFLDLKRQVPLLRVLCLLRYKGLRGEGARRYGPCPFGCNTHIRCCSFDLDDGLFYCHGCKIGGSQLDLFAVAEGLPLFQAALRLCKEAGIAVPFADDSLAQRLPKPPVDAHGRFERGDGEESRDA